MSDAPAERWQHMSGAMIFDVDGVLVATPHERAWQDALEVLMATDWRNLAPASTYAPERFTTAVYQEHVAGKPRLDGAAAVLHYFGLPHTAQLAGVYAERKQSSIDALVVRGEFEAYPDALRLVLALQARGVRMGAASSSKNANRFMERVRLDTFAQEAQLRLSAVPPGQTLRDIFVVNVCGRDLPQGKPHPAIFLLAAQELDVPPSRCIVVEDAPSGVEAARAAHMLSLGVARHDDAVLLTTAGADLVVASLDEVAVDALVEGRLERRSQTSQAARVRAGGE